MRLGLIGTGLATEKLHWPALAGLEHRLVVVAFADLSAENADRFVGYSGVSRDRYVPDYRQLLAREDVEAVLIALPIPLNLAVTRDALAAGKHVACEKPPGATIEEGRAFLALAGAYPDRVILVAENFFYRDDLRLARSMIDAGAIGTLQAMTWRVAFHLVPQPGDFSSTPWRHRPAYVGGPQLDAGVHFVSQMRLLCGDVEQLHAEVLQANSTMGGASHLTANVRFVSGAIGSYSSIHSEIPVPRDGNEMRLFGSEAVMTLAWPWLRVLRPDGSVTHFQVETSDRGYYNELLNFSDAISYGEPVIGTIAQSLHNMLVVVKALESAGSGTVQRLDEVPGGLSTAGIPLWRPRGASGLFDGLDVRVVATSAQE